MARPIKSKWKPFKRRQPEPETMPETSDARLREKMLRHHFGLGAADPNSPEAKAEAFLDKAFAERDPSRRASLAREALVDDPDNADALLLLGETSVRQSEAFRYYEQAVAAAERRLSPNLFTEQVGRFWGIVETRPYMRARERFACALAARGEREQAIAILRDMLRLNPGDNQGIRYRVLSELLFLDRNEEARELLAEFDDASGAWLYGRALLDFRKLGACDESRNSLVAALKANRHVPAYLFGDKANSEKAANSYSPGAESEAVVVTDDQRSAWRGTAGAVAWMRSVMTPVAKSVATPAKGPLAFIKKWLNDKLAVHGETWEADVAALRCRLQNGGGRRIWATLVCDHDSRLVLATEAGDGPPSAEAVWDTVVKAMREPAGSHAPGRPSELRVRPDAVWDKLRPHFEEIGIRVVTVDSFVALGKLFEDMDNHLSGPKRLGMIDAPGVTLDQLGAYFKAADAFYRDAPWKRMPSFGGVKLESQSLKGGPWYVIVMGQSGFTFGLAIYNDLELIQGMWANTAMRAHTLRSQVVTVMYGEESVVSPVDCDAAAQHGWPIAGPDAHPGFLRLKGEQRSVTPTPDDLRLATIAMSVIPDFARNHRDFEAAPVAVSADGVELNISWIMD